MKSTAVLVDGGFYIKRLKGILTIRNDNPVASDKITAKFCADILESIIKRHLSISEKLDKCPRALYRTFYYDAPPFAGNSQNPISGDHINFKQTPTYIFQTSLHSELIRKRKVALRLGKLSKNRNWLMPDQRKFKKLLNGTIAANELSGSDVIYVASQKQVDVKLGLDISTLAYKRLVDQIVIIAGDSDFVPVTKVARREGIDIILDPMKNSVSDDLLEHIDGLRDVSAKVLRQVKI